jgi:hypothetical protein
MEGMSPFAKNVMCGFISGGIYKSTHGFRPFVVGSVLGAGIIGSLNLAVNKGNQLGIISFEMKF